MTSHHQTDRRDDRSTRRRATTTATASALLVIVLTFIAAGCGGDSDTEANEAYADRVCTAVADWEQQIKSIATSFKDPQSLASLQAKATEAQTATKDLATQLQAIPAPDTSEGEAAKQQLDQLSTDATTTITTTKDVIAQIPSDASAGEISIAVLAVTPQLQTLATETKSAISTLQDAGDSLADAFKNTDSCTSLS